MKKIGVLSIFLLSILLISFLCFLTSATNGDGAAGTDDIKKIEETAGKVEEATGGLISEEGVQKPSPEKFATVKSKAEERIEKINEWLENNASWLKLIFGMKPEISWLFAITFLLILEGIVLLILNADAYLLEPFPPWLARIFGGLLLIILLYFKYPLWAAEKIIYLASLWQYWWYKLIVVVLLVILIILSGGIRKLLMKAKEKRKKAQGELDMERLHGGAEVAEAITKAVTKP